MNRYRVIVRRTTYEIVELLSLNAAEVEVLALRNEGVRTFKTDDHIVVLGKELITTIKESL